MISASELNLHKYLTTEEQDKNLAVLLRRINVIRAAWGRPMTVTSGLRSEADQKRINPIATKSNHLIGAAVDISDPHGELYAWLKEDSTILIDATLWCEENTVGWVHFQIFTPKSGRRWFFP